MKAQWIRVLDVIAIGPVMIWGGMEWSKDRMVPGMTLAALGVGTILYNAYNFFKKRALDGE
jgi:hypothetical protein